MMIRASAFNSLLKARDAKNKIVTLIGQNGASNAWIFNSGPNNNGKTNSNYVLPFFAYHTKVNDYEGIYYNRRY